MKNSKWFGKVEEGEAYDKVFFYDSNKLWKMIGFHTEKIGYNIIILFGKLNGKWPFIDILIDSVSLQKAYEDIRKVKDQLWDFKKKNKEARDELKRLISILSNDEWKEGDNAMECIETAQERKYMQYHKEDVITIFTENMEDPEEAARQLLEYFEIEVKEEMQRGKVTFIYE